ncbi:MAG: biopolymer transporter TolR, partial [Flavisolibacter sp.]
MKKRSLTSLLIFSFLCLQVYSQNKLGLFEAQTSIGNPLKKGFASYDSKSQVYIVYGSGENMWAGKDEFHFVHKKMKGNFILRLRGKLLGSGEDLHRKFGWMIRSSLDSNSAHVNAVVHGDGLTSLQFRRKSSAETEELKSSITHADVVQLERKGNRYILSVAK